MELAFALDAARRYWWLIAFCAVLGAIPGVVSRQESATAFESEAVMIVAPARDVRTQIGPTVTNERYVLGQLAVLQSSVLAARVAEQLGDGSSARDVLSVLTLKHSPETDVVRIVVRAESAERAEQVANAYADTYLSVLADRVDMTSSPMVEDIDDELQLLRDELGAVDDAIQAAMTPFVQSATSSDGAVAVPTADQVVPGLVSQRQLLLDELLDLQGAQTDLRVGAPFVVGTEIVERATPARAASSGGGTLLVVAGVLGAAVVGLFQALVLARFSPRLLSRRHANDLTGQEALGPVVISRDLGQVLRLPLSVGARATVAAIRSELDSRRESATLVVVVVEATRGDGSSSLAVALASSWSTAGFRTVVVDGDLVGRKVSEQLRDESLAATDRKAGHWITGLVPTVQPTLAMFPAPAHQTAWRAHADDMSAAVTDLAEVVVVDAGAIADSGLALQIPNDGIVVTLGEQTRKNLLPATIRQLRERDPALMTVWMVRSSPRRRGDRRPRAASVTTNQSRTEDDAVKGRETVF